MLGKTSASPLATAPGTSWRESVGSDTLPLISQPEVAHTHNPRPQSDIGFPNRRKPSPTPSTATRQEEEGIELGDWARRSPSIEFPPQAAGQLGRSRLEDAPAMETASAGPHRSAPPQNKKPALLPTAKAAIQSREGRVILGIPLFVAGVALLNIFPEKSRQAAREGQAHRALWEGLGIPGSIVLTLSGMYLALSAMFAPHFSKLRKRLEPKHGCGKPEDLSPELATFLHR